MPVTPATRCSSTCCNSTTTAGTPWRRSAGCRRKTAIRGNMADEILRHRRFPERYQKLMAERLYYELLQEQTVFGEYMPPSTVRISVNRRTGRPFYVVQWATYDGLAHLPIGLCRRDRGFQRPGGQPGDGPQALARGRCGAGPAEPSPERGLYGLRPEPLELQPDADHDRLGARPGLPGTAPEAVAPLRSRPLLCRRHHGP